MSVLPLHLRGREGDPAWPDDLRKLRQDNSGVDRVVVWRHSDRHMQQAPVDARPGPAYARLRGRELAQRQRDRWREK